MPKLPKRNLEQLRSHLSSLSAEELVDLVLERAARDDDLRDRLLVDAAKRGADAIDLKSFQRSLNAAVFDLAEGRYGAEYTSGDWAYGVNQAIGRLGELLAAGQAAAVVTLAEFALDALVEVMERADDSNGYIADLVADLERLHHDACVDSRPDRSTSPTGSLPARWMAAGTCSTTPSHGTQTCWGREAWRVSVSWPRHGGPRCDPPGPAITTPSAGVRTTESPG